MMRPRELPRLPSLGLATLSLVVGCAGGGNNGQAACLDSLDLTCAPLYVAANFEDVFEGTLLPSCSVGNSACHAPAGAKGGLVFDAEDPDAAWTALREPTGAEPRVVPGDPACSPLIQRLHSAETGFQMPPGMTLSEPERCAVTLWVLDGAQR